MYKLLFTFFILAICHNVQSQTKALTENGQEVILYQDGTWKYSQDSSNGSDKSDSLIINNQKFTKSSAATFLVKSNNVNVGVYINPEKWAFSPRRDNESNPEYRFNLKTGDGYCMMITEKTQIDIKEMRDIALINAQKASPDVRETMAEFRIVNNKKVLCLRLEGTIKGIKFIYLGYYYSNSNGTVQLVSYSSKQLFPAVQTELETFLNGLVEIEK